MPVGVDDIEEANNVGVAHLFEEGDLANSCGRHAFIFSFQADLLEGDDTLVGCCEVARFVDHAVSA
jgi:hypothetical protein